MTETRLNVNELLQNAFPELEPEDVQALGETARIRTYPAGVDICRQGERGTNLFVLGIGEADIIVHADDHHEIVVDTIGPNTYFGEMAFLGETTRSATIRTRDICHMLVIDHTDFEPVADANPGLLRRLLRQVIGHLRRNDQAVINELNLNHAALQRAYADLAEQEELRTEFIATLSHELRTPLTSIQGFLGLLNQGAIKGESLKVALDSITRNVQKMVGLTNDLLFLYEMHPAKPEYTYQNLADLLIEALNAAKEAVDGEATNVMLDIASDIPKVYVDKRTLILAIRALIENAFKFNPDKLPVRIEAYCVRDEEVAVAVKDEGIGIAAEAQQRIFDPFARLETEGGSHLFPGLGVGLTIARFVVERHNGRIEVDSQIGDGSTFTIFLPQPPYTSPKQEQVS